MVGQENILTFNLDWFVDKVNPLQQMFTPGQGGAGGETVTLDLSGFAGTTVALNFNSVVPNATRDLVTSIYNVSMNGTCLPSDFIFTSAFGDINPSSWGGCVASLEWMVVHLATRLLQVQCQFQYQCLDKKTSSLSA